VSLYRGLRGIKQVAAPREPHVFLRGKRAAVFGRVAMQMVVVDVSGFDPPIALGEIADIPMRRLSASARLTRRYD